MQHDQEKDGRTNTHEHGKSPDGQYRVTAAAAAAAHDDDDDDIKLIFTFDLTTEIELFCARATSAE
jgi:hypothetical protein